MDYPDYIVNTFYAISDLIMALWPRPMPSRAAFARAKVMAHRGIFDNRRVKENTLAAFHKAEEAGVWGIELDLRWTRDLEPVVHHDANTQRVFGIDREIAELSFKELRELVPEVPSLAEVLVLFAGKLVLVLELKDFNPSAVQAQREKLEKLLAPWQPAKDFYMIALEQDLLNRMDFFPSATYFPIGRVEFTDLSRMALEKSYAGIMGHYQFLKTCLIERHAKVGQLICTGFIESKNCLFRELNRGVDILSSNKANKIQKIINEHLERTEI